MEPKDNIVPYADWVLFLACKKAGFELVPDIADARAMYARNEFYRALCGMIAKHEKPPVDPDEEAVKRIIAKWSDIHDVSSVGASPQGAPRLSAAVAQYKKEKGNG